MIRPEGGAATLLRFARALRQGGVAVAPSQVATYARAVSRFTQLDLSSLYLVGRVSLICRVEDLPRYDWAFRRFWLAAEDVPQPSGATGESDGREERRQGGSPAKAKPPALPLGTGARGWAARSQEAWEMLFRWRDSLAGEGKGDGDDQGERGGGRYSARELLTKDVAHLLPAELLAALASLRSLLPEPPRLPARRRQGSRRGEEVDLRRWVRLCRAHGGELVYLPRRRRRRRHPRLILLGDVSGSMLPYAPLFLHFAHTLVRRRGRTEVYLFGTRLTKLTRALGRTPLEALSQLLPPDAGAGTRLGTALLAFANDQGRRGLAHNALLVIYSDGLDQGEPEQVVAALARLRRLCRRIIWLNPLKASPAYAPEARAMAAALPYLDRLLAGASVESFRQLLLELAPH